MNISPSPSKYKSILLDDSSFSSVDSSSNPSESIEILPSSANVSIDSSSLNFYRRSFSKGSGECIIEYSKDPKNRAEIRSEIRFVILQGKVEEYAVKCFSGSKNFSLSEVLDEIPNVEADALIKRLEAVTPKSRMLDIWELYQNILLCLPPSPFLSFVSHPLYEPSTMAHIASYAAETHYLSSTLPFSKEETVSYSACVAHLREKYGLLGTLTADDKKKEYWSLKEEICSLTYRLVDFLATAAKTPDSFKKLLDEGTKRFAFGNTTAYLLEKFVKEVDAIEDYNRFGRGGGGPFDWDGEPSYIKIDYMYALWVKLLPERPFESLDILHEKISALQLKDTLENCYKRVLLLDCDAPYSSCKRWLNLMESLMVCKEFAHIFANRFFCYPSALFQTIHIACFFKRSLIFEYLKSEIVRFMKSPYWNMKDLDYYNISTEEREWFYEVIGYEESKAIEPNPEVAPLAPPAPEEIESDSCCIIL